VQICTGADKDILEAIEDVHNDFDEALQSLADGEIS